MPGLPTVQVLLDDTTGSGTWPYDITQYVELGPGYSITRGRSDELGDVQPTTLGMTLDNTDGRFTLGTTGGGYGTINTDRRIQIKHTVPGIEDFNLIPAASADFESGVGSWIAAGSPLPTLSSDTAHVWSGAKSLKITWAGSGGFPQGQVTVSGLTIGQTYTFSAYVYVPTGNASVIPIFATTVGATMTAKDQWVRVTVTHTATATSHGVGIRGSAPVNLDVCWVDAAMVNAGTLPGDFNTAAQVTTTRCTLYVQDWPTEWPGGSQAYAVATITAVDRMSRLNRRVLRSVIEQEILLDTSSPSARAGYYTLGEPAGSTSAADSSGKSSPNLVSTGSGTAVVFGNATGPGTDSLTAATFAGGKYLRNGLDFGDAFYSATIECFFSVASGNGGNLLDGSPDSSATSLAVDAGTGHVVWTPTTGSTISTSTSYADSAVHHAAVICDASGSGTAELFVDGVSQGSTSGTIADFDDLRVGRDFTGSISHVFILETATALSSTRVIAHANAGLNGFNTERSDQRIARYASYANIPTADQTLETGVQVNVPHFDITGMSPTAAMQEVVNSEDGLLFLRGDGKLVFQNRTHRAAQVAADLTITADAMGPNDRFTGDMQRIVNTATVTRAGGAGGYAENADSIATHEQYPTSMDLKVATDDEATDRASWEANAYPEPLQRLGSLTLDLFSQTVTIQASAQALELSDRIQITGLPNQVSSTADLIAEGWTETVSISAWGMQFNASPWTPNAVWVLDDTTYSVLGTTTRLSF